jgi:hypothetical protein
MIDYPNPVITIASYYLDSRICSQLKRRHCRGAFRPSTIYCMVVYLM